MSPLGDLPLLVIDGAILTQIALCFKEGNGLSFGGWQHNWLRLMGGSECGSILGVVRMVLAVVVPHFREPPWPPYCCPLLCAVSCQRTKPKSN